MIIQTIHATFAPVFGTLGRPGRDAEHDELELKAARVKIGFATILRSPVLLLPYLGYLIPLASHSQHILNALNFQYRHLDFPSLFWKGKTAVAFGISHGRYQKRLDGKCDPNIWPLSYPSWFKRIKRQTPLLLPNH